MAFDYSKLIGRIVEKYGSRRNFARAYGISENALSQKLTGKMAITTGDIVKMSSSDYLDIAKEKIPAYFFKEKVQDTELT